MPFLVELKIFNSHSYQSISIDTAITGTDDMFCPCVRDIGTERYLPVKEMIGFYMFWSLKNLIIGNTFESNEVP